ncbi:hypothetical protein AC249_AIPGENE28244 [Exaiptasia diaphana]|nr:hypothetical protein AC249_AIPGENE28244 [Exaiptasia diaphana]
MRRRWLEVSIIDFRLQYDLPRAVQQIAKFLGKDLPSEMIQRIAQQTTFASMSDGKGRFCDGDPAREAERDPNIKFIRKECSHLKRETNSTNYY